MSLRNGNTFLQVFDEIISPLLLSPMNPKNPIRNRVPTLKFAFELLARRSSTLIVETGCMRADHGELCWGDDGCSTLLFDLFSSCNGGKVATVDISERNIAHANSLATRATQFSCKDSVQFLAIFATKSSINLLYLDSFDFDPSDPLPSQSHHLEELKAVFDDLASGTIIIVDDADVFCDNSYSGKSNMVYEYLASRNIFPKINGYQLLWLKP